MAWGGLGGWLSGLWRRNAGAGQISQLAGPGQTGADLAQPAVGDFSIAPTGAYTGQPTSSGAYNPAGYSIAPQGSYAGQVGGAPSQRPGTLSRLAELGREDVMGLPQIRAEREGVPQATPSIGEGEPRTPLQPSGSGRDIGQAFMMNVQDPMARAKVAASERELESVRGIAAATKNIIAAAAGGAAGAGGGGGAGGASAAAGAAPAAAGGAPAAAGGGTGFMASFKGGFSGAGGGGSRLGGALGGLSKLAAQGQGGGQTAQPTVGVTGGSQQPSSASVAAQAQLAEQEAGRPSPGGGGMQNPLGEMQSNLRSLEYAKRAAKVSGLLGGGVQQAGPYRWWTGAAV